MNFLLYIENSAENLQFYLWFRDYVKRFEQLPENEKKLSPPWVPEQPKPKLTHTKVVKLKVIALWQGYEYCDSHC